ncbi:MAG TPA: SDR family oxidoreductase [Pirellulales bacterium]|nr:SDR family oxidoreductase [Pirellulales bacterium]
MTAELKGRIAVVTGGSRGIGRAVALALAKAGARVFSGDQSLVAVNQATNRELGITELLCDVRVEEQVRALIEHATAPDGKLDILVSNAGINLVKQVPDATEAEWDACLETNLRGGFFAAKHAIPAMKKGGGGAIVFMASNAGLLPRAHDPVYSTSKAALVALSNSLALCHADDRIRSNAVCPGPVSGTSILEEGMAGGADPRELERGFIEASPLARAWGRMITPEEVAAAVLYLVSPAAAMVTGTALRIDGGKSLGVPPMKRD